MFTFQYRTATNALLLLIGSTNVCYAQHTLEAPDVVDRIVARYDSVFSARIHYTVSFVSSADAGKDSSENCTFSFSPGSWARRSSNGHCEITHKGKHVDFQAHPQRQGWVDHTAHVENAKQLEDESLGPPKFAGSVWFRCTRDFMEANRSAARKIVEHASSVDKTVILEWEVPTKEICAAFYLVIAKRQLQQPGVLRVYAMPEKGYVLSRVEFLSRSKDNLEKIALFEAQGFREWDNGIWFPQKMTEQTFDVAEKPAWRIVYDITGIELVNQPIPDVDFEILLPVGTSVTDCRSDKAALSFRVTPKSNIPSDLQDVFPEMGRRWRTVTNAVGLGLIGGIVFGMAYWWSRRTRVIRDGNL